MNKEYYEKWLEEWDAMSDEEKEERAKAVLEMKLPPMSYTPDGLPSDIACMDDNGVFVLYADPDFRMRRNEGSDPEDWVAPIQAGFEKQDYPIYEKLLALKAEGKWKWWEENL